MPYVAAGDDGCGDGSTYLFCPDPAHPADSDAYDDYAMTMAAIDHIRYAVGLQQGDGDGNDGGDGNHGEGSGRRPFFVGLGTYRPHMRAHLPSSVTDLYPHQDIRIAQHPHPPAGGVPPFSFKSQVDEGSATVSLPAYVVGNATDTDGDVVFTAPSLIQPDTFPEYFQQMFRAGYYSGVTLVDSYIGLVLDALDELGVADDTIVVHTSDHGYLLGEHAEWAKQTLYDNALRIPLMIRTPASLTHTRRSEVIDRPSGEGTPQPGTPQPSPRRIAHGIVELNDLYPTLAELAGLPAPAASVEGKSFAALVVDAIEVRSPNCMGRIHKFKIKSAQN